MSKLQVIEHRGQRVLTTAQLADAFGAETDYINRNFNNNKDRYTAGKHYFLLEGKDLHDFKMTTGKNDGSLLRVNRLYLWTEKGAWMHAKSLNTDPAWAAYEALVDDYYAVKTPGVVHSYMIDDPIKRAEAWIEEMKAKQALEAKMLLDQPKVVFADAVSASKSSILIGELAKLLKQNGVDTGQQRLFAWLRDNGFLIRRNGTDYNMPTQRSMEMGLFEIKETSISHSDGHITISKTPKVTGKGQIYFINRFKSEAI